MYKINYNKLILFFVGTCKKCTELWNRLGVYDTKL